jgi:hypothetical protein
MVADSMAQQELKNEESGSYKKQKSFSLAPHHAKMLKQIDSSGILSS